MALEDWNPFSKRDSHSTKSIITYKVLTLLTWLLSIIVSFYYTFQAPHDGHYARRKIWHQNYHHPTAFTMNAIIAGIYWIVLFILQGVYITQLFSKTGDRINAAASVGSHFILNNLFHFAFVMLYVRSHFVWAELIVIVNFVNLSALYFRHNTTPKHTVHLPVCSGPLAWTFVAIYWNGAMMVSHPNHIVPRIFGNIFIWSLMVYGGFFIVTYRDYTMGFCLSVLAAAIGVAQFTNKTIALQWIFAFTIMAVLFVSTVVVAWLPAREREQTTVASGDADRERAPLLGEN